MELDLPIKSEWLSAVPAPAIDIGLHRLQLKCFPVAEFHQAVTFLSDIYQLHDGVHNPDTLYITGQGRPEVKKMLKERLNLRYEYVIKLSCYVRGFTWMLKQLPRKQMLFPLNLHKPNYLKAFTEMMKSLLAISEAGLSNMTCPAQPSPDQLSVEHLLIGDDVGTRPLVDTMEDLFPCILAVMGSSVDYIKVFENGKYEIIGRYTTGEKMLVGMSSLLCGIKTYEEMTDCARRGNSTNIDSHIKDLGLTENNDDFYSKTAELFDKDDDNLLIFPFGKAVGKKLDQLNPDDITQALLQVNVQEITRGVYNAAARDPDVSHVFLCGHYTTSDLVKSEITLNWLRRRVTDKLYAKDFRDIRHHFLRPGEYIGALGAFLKQLDAAR